MHRTATRLLTAALLLFVAVPTFAGSYIVPTDADLIRSADAIAIVTIQSSHSYFTNDGIATDYTAIIEQTLRAAPAAGSTVILTQRGGSVGRYGYGVSTEPSFVVGERTLLMMRRLESDRFTTLSGELGKFEFGTEGSRSLLTRGAVDDEIFGWDSMGRQHNERARDAAAFIRYIERVAAGEEPDVDYYVFAMAAAMSSVRADSHVAGTDYTSLVGSGIGLRANGGSFSMQSTNTQTGVSDLTGAINSARGLWNDEPNSNINIGYVGGGGSGVYEESPPDFQNLLFFDQPDSGPLAGSPVGQANYWFENTSHMFNGSAYRGIIDCDIVVQVGMTGNLFVNILGHEKGHCLGFRHSNQPAAGQTTNTGDALMNASVGSGTPQLRPWDQDAASHVYGTPPPCTPPSINSQSGNLTITQGQNLTLSVTAGGTTPLTYQWYIGNPPTTSQPTGTNSASLNLSPSTTTTYWVRVTNSCGTADSTAITVTVNPPSCTGPAISTHPQSVTITQGNSTVLSVGATGSGTLSYQWYIGTAPNTSSPTGTNSSSLTVNPSTTTSYWVRVTGCEGNSVNSNTATVTVNPGACTPPFFIAQPQSTTITEGQTAGLTVNVSGTGPFVYSWFIGTPPSTSNPTGGNSATLLVSPTTTTTYWVRVIGQCDPAAISSAATVIVTPNNCPNVTVGTPTATNLGNGTFQLNVTASGGEGALTYQWFQGPVPGVGTFIGTGQQISVPTPTTPTSYWVRVSNNCGKQGSSPTVVTISPGCDVAVITTEPADQTIANGASATLNVVFTSATAGTVRWYRGVAPDKSNEIGTGNSVSTGPLTATTQFFATITNSCGEKFTRTVTITVGAACTSPVILATTPAQATKIKGETVTLNVIATGTATLNYQWFEGTTGDTSKPVGTSSATFTSAPLTTSTRFWVRVSNGCGNASSNTFIVDVKVPRRRAARH